MRRTRIPARKGPAVWRDLGPVALPAAFADTFDDRVGDDLFDCEDEREAVEVVAQEMRRTLN